MKFLGISGSHRKNQNSHELLQTAMEGVKEVDSGAEPRIMQIADLKIGPCLAVCCDKGLCGKEPFECVLKDDLQMIFDEMKSADGVLIASPRYFIVPSKLQAFIERMYCAHYFTKWKHPTAAFPLENKPCGLLTVSSGGYYSTISLLEHLEWFALFLHMRMITTPIGPFRGVVAKNPVSKDKHALEHARILGQMIAKAVEEKK